MLVKDIKVIAKEMDIKVGKMGKADLIHAIQTGEGNTPCFATGLTECDQLDCKWRGDCIK